MTAVDVASLQRSPPPARGGWSDARIERLKALQAEHLSASEIGAALGISRNAVIGKLHRIGLRPASNGTKNTTLRARSPYRDPNRKPRLRPKPSRLAVVANVHVRRMNNPEPPPPLPAADEPLPDSRRLSLVELDMTRHCRWPLGDPRTGEFFYCAADREFPGNDSIHCYCRVHFQLSQRGGQHGEG